MTKAESFAMQYGYYDEEKKRACCVGYNAGYKQAEKDLALTWKDIESIIHIYESSKDIIGDYDVELYEEILKRYLEEKK